MSRTRPAIAPNPYGEADDELDAPTLGLVVPVVGPAERVDKRGAASVRFAGSAPPSAGADHRVIASRPVGPGRPPIVATARKPGGEVGAMAEYPIQITKVQPPPLRADTLARDRLLDWLKIRIHRRVVLVLAEAGYGKTTLMADFSRRTRIRTFWYRLDRGDRDWVPFLAHIVASIRTHLPEFGSATDGLIRETGTTSPPLDIVLETLMRELAGLPAEPAAFVLDDFHLVEDAPDIVRIVRELVSRGPERMSIVVVSRQTPDLQLARLRALGEVAELRTDDLRFDTTETSRLFRETYELRLDDALLAELSSRTEGWAASLQLVRTAIRDRSPSERRAFIHSISGAEGELYDYLAEEVIGDQPLELQQFLMRTSVLEQIDPELASVAATIPRAAARIAIDAGEALGLFGRRGTINRFHVRAHPLVRDFLQERLVRAVGPDGVATIHRAVAQVAESRDWRLAGHHYRAAGDMADARRVLAAAIETILATGAYAAAEELALSLPDDDPKDFAVLVIRSRGELQRGDTAAGLDLAERAHRVAPGDTATLLTLMAARILAGDVRGGLELAEHLGSHGFATEPQMLGQSFRGAFGTSMDGDIQAAIVNSEELTSRLRGTDRYQYLGVGLSNLAYLQRSRGDAASSLAAADEAVSVLEMTSGVAELTSARLARAMALAETGDLQSARAEVIRARTLASGAQLTEVAYEAGELEALYGSEAAARSLLEPHVGQAPNSDSGQQLLLAQVLLEMRAGDHEAAGVHLELIHENEPRSAVAFEARRRLAQAFRGVQGGDPDAGLMIDAAVALADRQGAALWGEAARTLRSCLIGGPLPRATNRAGQVVSPSITIVAEAVCNHLDRWSVAELAGIREVALTAQPRWQAALRRGLQSTSNTTRLRAGTLLDEIGEAEDIELLRRASRRVRGPGAAQLGRGLARRLAARVFVEDLGRVRILIGDRSVDGTDVRRKVLALLCYLLSRNRFACSRDEAMDALWPDADPADSLNSLNQTVYFLRRVFEPEYSDDLSPGYVGQNSETIWLDRDLIASRSRVCRELVRAMATPPTPEQVATLAEQYLDRFALDFSYEEWAVGFRESLHRTYLRVVEQSLKDDLDSLHLARGIDLGERVADVEPESDSVGASLVRLYRQSGSLSAAAEQYGSYTRQLRDLGVDPPAFEDV